MRDTCDIKFQANLHVFGIFANKLYPEDDNSFNEVCISEVVNSIAIVWSQMKYYYSWARIAIHLVGNMAINEFIGGFHGFVNHGMVDVHNTYQQERWIGGEHNENLDY